MADNKFMGYNEQRQYLINILKEKIHRLETLPADEAKKEAQRNLYEAGIIDNNGNYTEAYKHILINDQKGTAPDSKEDGPFQTGH